MKNDLANAVACARQVRRSVARLSRQLRPNLRRDGIGMAKLSVIAHIKRVGRVTPTQLAQYEGVKIQSLTRVLAELEADDWLIRVPHAEDARQSVLSLTPTGCRRLAEAAQEKDVRLAKLIQTRLSAEDRSVLLKACALMEGLSDVFGAAEA